MAENISAPVGTSGQNRRSDVEIIQRLLMRNGVNPGRIDGICGQNTIRAIIDFQSRFLSRPDGRVDPNGKTLRYLNEGSQQMPGQKNPVSPNPTQIMTDRTSAKTVERINQSRLSICI